MEGIIFLIIGAFLFAVIGVIVLLAKTSSQAELLEEYGTRIDLLETRLQSFMFREKAAPGTAVPDADTALSPVETDIAAGEAGEWRADGGAADTAGNIRTVPFHLDRETSALTNTDASVPPDTDTALAPIDDTAAREAGETDAGYGTEAAAAAAPDAGGGSPVMASLSGFIRGGNLWAAGGVVLLIAGFAMLITWLARRSFFTVEMGIAAAAVSGLVMLGAGWRLRNKRRVYFLLLQGGGIGILYLSVFAANRLTPWFPVPVTLILLSFLVLPAVFLALLQGAQVLAFFGFLGGYAAPILLSQGGGSHLFLFSYYLVLDIGVFVIAYFRFWKGLNLLAFLCTFAVSLVWIYDAGGMSREAVLSSEPFFLAYILLFTLLGLHAIRQQRERGGTMSGAYIEWGLVFGTPLLGSLLQWQVLSYVEHGYAVASIAFSAFYLLLAFIIKRFKAPAIFIEGYLGFSVLLANLAIPLELSSRITSAVWAAEGVIVYFLGLRFRRRKVWIAALLFQAAASLAFIPEMESFGFGELAWRSPRFIGALIIALSALVTVLLTQKLFPRNGGTETADTTENGEGIAETGEQTGTAESGGAYIALIVVFTIQTCAWWFGAWLYECLRTAAEPWAFFFIVASLSALLFCLVSRIFRCAALTAGALPSLCCALALCLFGMGRAVWNAGDGPFSFTLVHFNYFEGLYCWGWPVFFILQIPILIFAGKAGGEKIRAPWLFTVVLMAAAVFSLSGRYLSVRLGLSESWTSFAGLLPLFAMLLPAALFRPRFNPPPLYRTLMFSALPFILCGILGIWFLVTLFMPGNPDPLPLYLPVLNPLDLEELFCIVLFLLWQNSARRAGDAGSLSRRSVLIIADSALFLILITIIARSIHFYGGIPYTRVPGSEAFQLCLFIFWAVWGIGHIIWGNRMKLRPLWIAGAILTVADIAKLLLLDLAEAGTVIRIVSFFIAGFILLFIGWVSPLPPARKETAGETEEP